MHNHVTLIGNLTRDADTTTGPTTTLTRLRLATNSGWRDGEGTWQETTEYHSVVAFGRLAESCSAHCLKGRRLLVTGRLRTRDYEGGDGLRRYMTEVVAEAVRYLDAPHGAARDGDEATSAGDPDPLSIATDPAEPNGRGRRTTAAAAV